MSATKPHFSLLKILERQAPLLMDGDKQTVFQQFYPDLVPPWWKANLEQHDAVLRIHQSYLEAGATILRTNTEGANRFELEATGFINREEAVNNSAMALLKQSLGFQGISAGSIIPVRKEGLSAEARAFAYGQQAIYLSDTGAGLFVLSEFSDDAELCLAIGAIRRSSQKEVLAHLRVQGRPDILKIVATLQHVYQEGAHFTGIQVPVDMPDLMELVDNMIEELGIVSLLLDESYPGDTVSDQFGIIAQTILEKDIAILGGGRQTSNLHIQKMKQFHQEIYF
ncbi:MAG: homocysteine S-methyltransferase family protein [SAR324 cluster bacterium]|nr:homocysteine S-methyltransferase family protein [SAR324 cluster bacterium]